MSIDLSKCKLQRHDCLAIRIAAPYLVLSIVWILYSDRLIELTLTSLHENALFQTFKGIGFVVVTSVILYLFVRRQTKALIDKKKALSKAQNDVIERLAMAADWRDDETGEHVRRVSLYAQEIAREYGLNKERCEVIRIASTMHDVGKIGIPDEIMLFEGEFSDEQRKIMIQHTVIGAQLLDDGDSEIMKLASEIALNHHERWDGKGYPYGLQSEDIPIEARITAVADVFDALTTVRRYKESWDFDRAVSEIADNSGSQFDPEVVEAFLRSIPAFFLIHNTMQLTVNSKDQTQLQLEDDVAA